MRTYPRWVHRGQRTVQDAEGNKGNDKGADEEALSSIGETSTRFRATTDETNIWYRLRRG